MFLGLINEKKLEHIKKQKFHSKTEITWDQLARTSLNTFDLPKE